MNADPPERLLLALAHYEAMLAAVQGVYPLEGCGLLAGRDHRVTQVYPVANAAASATRFRMEPQAQVRAMLDLAANGWDLLAIYHSHPHGPNQPSATDIAEAYYPSAAQIIISLADRNRPVVGTFVIGAGRAHPISLSIV